MIISGGYSAGMSRAERGKDSVHNYNFKWIRGISQKVIVHQSHRRQGRGYATFNVPMKNQRQHCGVHGMIAKMRLQHKFHITV